MTRRTHRRLTAAILILGAIAWASLAVVVRAETYIVSATICRETQRTDCLHASWTVRPRPGEGRPWCDGSGPLNTVVAGLRGFLPRNPGDPIEVVLAPESIQCRSAG